MSEHRFSNPVERLLELGDASPHSWADYAALGICREHVPELTRILQHPELSEAWSDRPAGWAAIHAWRALGQLEAAEAVPALVSCLEAMDPDDDWSFEELPVVLGMIGAVSFAPLEAILVDALRPPVARQAAAWAIAEVGVRHPDQRDRCVAALTRQLDRGDRFDEASNAYLVSDLLKLRAVEAVPVIRAAYLAGRVHTGFVCWGDVRDALDLEPAEGDPPEEIGDPFSLAPTWDTVVAPTGVTRRREKSKAKRKLARRMRKQNRHRR